MNSTPLVSVGLPTYNRSSDLRQAVESVLGQDYSNLEIVISDNGSTDETQRLCEEFCARDSRVNYIRQVTNRGPRANFLEVLTHSRGEFFLCLGDDDWLDRSYISQCIQKLIDNPDYSLVCGSAKYYQNGQLLPDQGEIIDLLQDDAEQRVLAYYAQVDYNSTFYGVMRRKYLDAALPQNVLGGDWLLIAAIAFRGKIETIKSPLVHRSFAGTSRTLKGLTESLGISDIHAGVPHLSIAVSACKDIAWRSKTYSSLSRRARISLAYRVFSVFWRRYFRPYWRDALYPYWARPILFAISVRDKIRKRYVS
jgi:glycosyltransferase involved in cell wall biosynthesis